MTTNNYVLDAKLNKIESRLDHILLRSKAVLSVDDLMAYTGFSRGHVYKLTGDREIPFYKLRGKSLWFDREEIDQWLLSNKQESDKPQVVLRAPDSEIDGEDDLLRNLACQGLISIGKENVLKIIRSWSKEQKINLGQLNEYNALVEHLESYSTACSNKS